MRLYIAGPMTGYPEYNYPAFERAEELLVAKGYEVLNPTTNNPEHPTWVNYMRASIAQVIAADGIATLDNWQMSAGAALEVQIAHALRIPVMSLDTWFSRPAEQKVSA